MATTSDGKVTQVDSPTSEDIHKDDEEVWDKETDVDVEVAEGVAVDTPDEEVSEMLTRPL